MESYFRGINSARLIYTHLVRIVRLTFVYYFISDANFGLKRAMGVVNIIAKLRSCGDTAVNTSTARRAANLVAIIVPKINGALEWSSCKRRARASSRIASMFVSSLVISLLYLQERDENMGSDHMHVLVSHLSVVGEWEVALRTKGEVLD